MTSKIQKAQVVLAAIDQAGQSFQFLLLKTNVKRGEFWQNVTGKIDAGETFEEGALREAIEETSLKIDSIVDITTLPFKYEFVDQRGRNVIEKCFLILLDSPWEVKLDPSEHQSYKWVAINEIHPEIVKYPSNYEPLEKAQMLLKHWGK